MATIERRQGVTLIQLGPEYQSLDAAMLAKIEQTLLREAQGGEPPRLVLDLTHTEFFGSAFLEAVTRAWKRVRERDGQLVLCGLQPFCKRVLKATRLDTLWKSYPTCDEAIAAIAGPAESQD